MRILIDANIWISGLISRNMRDRLDVIIGRADVFIYGSVELISEIEATATRPKIAKYLSSENTALYIDIISSRVDIIIPQSKVQICRDPNDDYLLAICKDAAIEYFITGDKDLLIHHPFGETQILTLTEFESIINR